MVHKSILRLPEVKARTGLSRSSIYNAIKAGTFPAHVSLGARAVGWVSTEIDEWIAARISAVRSTLK
ncbi:MAG TPA: AlpA family transcriptional regulator [Noviherbaspirillum sp.]|uniref:helix-turn-helix transcriptional regulator n=1 Tax=Noviherbaspirillum sp. TaxID=1926288 RepID=UPI002F92068E